MDKTNVELQLNTKLYNEMDEVCEDLGMTVDDAFQIFARKMVNEQGIPFEVTEKEYPQEDHKALLLKITEMIAGIGLLIALTAGIVSLIRALKDHR